jgi:hypothetical protein
MPNVASGEYRKAGPYFIEAVMQMVQELGVKFHETWIAC